MLQNTVTIVLVLSLAFSSTVKCAMVQQCLQVGLMNVTVLHVPILDQLEYTVPMGFPF